MTNEITVDVDLEEVRRRARKVAIGALQEAGKRCVSRGVPFRDAVLELNRAYEQWELEHGGKEKL